MLGVPSSTLLAVAALPFFLVLNVLEPIRRTRGRYSAYPISMGRTAQRVIFSHDRSVH